MERKLRRRKPMAEINVVPYIDVMLVLLIIFMVTAPLLMQGVEVELPQAPAEPVSPSDTEPLIVSLRADGTLYLNLGGDQERPVPLARLTDQVGKVLARKPETPVMIWGDQQVPYGDVVALMVALQGAGASSVGMVTEPPDS